MTTSEEFQAALVTWARNYASMGWPVFPLHSPQKQPRQICDCPDRPSNDPKQDRPGGPRCPRPAKHPRTLHGLSDATCDPQQIDRWWRQWPRANVGVAVPSDFVVVDIDDAQVLLELADRGWKIPDTPTVSTARGWHHWFAANAVIRPGSHFLDGLDMRGPGGYVVAPPSLHASGVVYSWEAGKSPAEIDFAEAPQWVYGLIEEARANRQREPLPSSGSIMEHSRNDTLTRIAGAMRRYGCTEKAILAALEVENDERCSPPLDAREVQTIAWSVSRYAPQSFSSELPAITVWEPM